MTNEQFERAVSDFFLQTHKMLMDKNIQYASAFDPLANFNETASFLGVTKEQSVLPHIHKHYRRVVNAIQQGKPVPSDSLQDIINYCVFLHVMQTEEA